MRAPVADLPALLSVPPVRRAFAISVRPPGSKSLTNRALLLAAMAQGKSTIRGGLRDADDAIQMMRAVEKLGACVTINGTDAMYVEGVGGRWRVPNEGVTLDVNNAGTAARFLAAAAVLAPNPVTIDGSPRMRERPISELVEILRRVGADVEYLGRAGCLPIRIVPRDGGLGTSGVIDLPSTKSSQFVSAVLLIGPWLPTSLTLRLHGRVTSASYVAMTLGLLSRLKANVQHAGDMRVLRVGPAMTYEAEAYDAKKGSASGRSVGVGIPAFEYDVEPDASGATYFWAAAALVPGATAKVEGIGSESLQGDSNFPGVLERMGAVVDRSGAPDPYILVRGSETIAPVMADMSDMPDAVMTLAVVASFAAGVSVIRGVRTLRVKESDRVAALQAELGKIGVKVECPVAGDDDVMSVTPPVGGVACGEDVPGVEFETYNDHRMAMALALVGLRRAKVSVKNPRCVDKTYPEFWSAFRNVYGCEA